MTRTELIAHLYALDACNEMLEWIEQTPGEPADLWAACQRGDWMIWLLVAVGYDARTLRHIACDCAVGVLPIYERAHPDDRRPRDAIAVARRYADGEATEEERAASSDAANAAARAAAYAAAGAAARAAAGAAAYASAGAAAYVAADAASWAASSDAANAAAWTTAMARHADMVRARVSWADVEQVMGGSDRAEEIDCDQDSRYAEVAQDDTETEPRPPTCECQWEAGDSPCCVHGEEVGDD